jgi:hypothetical protein
MCRVDGPCRVVCLLFKIILALLSRDHEWKIEMSFKIPVDFEKTSEDNE